MTEQTIYVPDIGGAKGVEVIEILVHSGDLIAANAPIVTLESDKASMEIPAPVAGKVLAIAVKIGDKISQGAAILTLQLSEKATIDAPTPAAPVAEKAQEAPASIAPAVLASSGDSPYAGPAVRRLAKEFGIALSSLQGTGAKSRITRGDIIAAVKAQTSVGSMLPMAPEIDFSQFGPIEKKPLSKIKRLTAQQVHRAWVTIPHVTQFDEVDVTALEEFRRAESVETEKSGYKLTLLAFIVKALTKVLQQYPQFNSSLDASGSELIYKQYINMGVAVETPNGLVVPVIKQADRLSVKEIAETMHRLSLTAREKGIALADMTGGTFTVSSLGGISGTGFTPIVNQPEVAILGISRLATKPVYQGNAFVPRLILPFSLSYDHRVIDGAEAARFTRALGSLLSDIRRILM